MDMGFLSGVGGGRNHSLGYGPGTAALQQPRQWLAWILEVEESSISKFQDIESGV